MIVLWAMGVGATIIGLMRWNHRVPDQFWPGRPGDFRDGLLLVACSSDGANSAPTAFCDTASSQLSNLTANPYTVDPVELKTSYDAAVETWSRLSEVAPSVLAPSVQRIESYVGQALELMESIDYDLSDDSPEQEAASRLLSERSVSVYEDWETFQQYVASHCPMMPMVTATPIDLQPVGSAEGDDPATVAVETQLGAVGLSGAVASGEC